MGVKLAFKSAFVQIFQFTHFNWSSKSAFVVNVRSWLFSFISLSWTSPTPRSLDWCIDSPMVTCPDATDQRNAIEIRFKNSMFRQLSCKTESKQLITLRIVNRQSLHFMLHNELDTHWWKENEGFILVCEYCISKYTYLQLQMNQKLCDHVFCSGKDRGRELIKWTTVTGHRVLAFE